MQTHTRTCTRAGRPCTCTAADSTHESQITMLDLGVNTHQTNIIMGSVGSPRDGPV
eukprot:m.140891 g.140891  ORF g.140891 m.140891 type:complete len:56 (+) comp22828_c0_seq7:2935-3102(+)